jgi:REP element-mobilizing transposase RayT
MNFLIWGILARAKQLYDVKVCHFLFMANHFHMMLVVSNPDDVPGFVGYVKAETAHAINQLIGRRTKRIWINGYDSPCILTVKDVIRYIRYIYLNPVVAGLVNSIDEYPGVSSWPMFKSGNHNKLCKHLKRPMVKRLSHPALTVNEQKAIVEHYQCIAKVQYEFILEPNAWMDCFPGLTAKEIKRLNALCLELIQTRERKLRKERFDNHSEVLGSTVLRRQSMLKEYSSKKFSPKMVCLSSDVELRIRFIHTYKALCDKAREVYQAWKHGNLSLRIPPGLFAPRLPTLVCAYGLT